jgi:hypothetical protein
MSVDAVFDAITDPSRREDCRIIDHLRQKLGKHAVGKSCLYIRKLADIDLRVLEDLVTESVRHTRATHGA